MERSVWLVLGIGANAQVFGARKESCIELPGHGAKSAESGSLADAASVLARAIEGGGECTLVGWSLGAVVVGLALGSEDVLARASRVVLLAPALSVGDEEARRNSSREFGLALRGLMSTDDTKRQQGAREYAGLVIRPAQNDDLTRAFEMAALSVDPTVYRQLLTECWDVRQIIADVARDRPVIVAHGRDDAVLTVEGSRQFAASVPDVVFHEIPGGHAWFAFDPASLTRLL